MEQHREKALINFNRLEVIRASPETFLEEIISSNNMALSIGLARINYSTPLMEILCKNIKELSSLYGNVDFPHAKIGIDSIRREISFIEKDRELYLSGYNVGIDLNMLARNNKEYFRKLNDLPTDKPFRIGYDIDRLPEGDEMIELLEKIPRLGGVIIWNSINKQDFSDSVLAANTIMDSLSLETCVFTQKPIDKVIDYNLPDNLRVSTSHNNFIRYFRKILKIGYIFVCQLKK